MVYNTILFSSFFFESFDGLFSKAVCATMKSPLIFSFNDMVALTFSLSLSLSVSLSFFLSVCFCVFLPKVVYRYTNYAMPKISMYDSRKSPSSFSYPLSHPPCTHHFDRSKEKKKKRHSSPQHIYILNLRAHNCNNGPFSTWRNT